MCKFYIVVWALVNLSSLFMIYVTSTSYRNYIYTYIKTHTDEKGEVSDQQQHIHPGCIRSSH